jgi:acyl-CoA synthetase (AMP-forming)/AMP-acid ligase II
VDPLTGAATAARPYQPAYWADASPDRPAVITGSGATLTYRELEDRSRRLAQALRHAGLGVGDHVALLIDNQIRAHELLWGAYRAGLYYTPINTHLSPDEAAFVINDSGARALLTSVACGELARAAADRAPGIEHRWVCDGPIDGFDRYEDEVDRWPADRLDDECEGVPMTYSSGTTGRPKAVKQPMSGSPLGGSRGVYDFFPMYPIGEGSVFLCPAPLYHAAPMAWSMSLHRIGATCVLMERFDPRECLRLIETHRVTHGYFVPTMFVRMLKLPDRERQAFDLSSLVRVVHAAAPCPIGVKAQMLDWWGPVIDEFYAGSEGGGITYIDGEEWRAHPGSVGRTELGTIHICDDDGVELPTGEPGVIWFSDTRAINYHNDPAKSRTVTNDRGWVTLWDMGYLDADGRLYLTDRKQFMIVSGGVNIYPQEVEDALLLHPDVADAAVFGVPNDEFGEEVKAVVQPVAAEQASLELGETLIGWCRERLAHYKCPRSVDFVTELPRGDNGKLYKRALRDPYWTGHRTHLV